MIPKIVRFADDWLLPEALSGIEAGIVAEVRELARRKLIASGDSDAETGRTIGGFARELRSVVAYRQGTSLFIDWRFVNSDEAEVLLVFRFPRPEDEVEEPPTLH